MSNAGGGWAEEGAHLEAQSQDIVDTSALSKQLLRLLEKQIKARETAIAELIAADEKLKTKAERQDAIPGAGPIMAATVLAELPGLGQLSHQAAAT